MGKIRVKTLGDEKQEKEEKKKAQVKREEKKAKEAKEDLQQTEEPTSQSSDEEPKQGTKVKKSGDKRQRSQRYQAKLLSVDKSKTYTLKEALELLEKVHLARFDETVELHINTNTIGVSGTVTLPHGRGKELRVAIADDALVAEIEKGKITFDILLSTPQMMPKLGRVARVLGPRGLMPNPKNGTITNNPEDDAKKYKGGQVNFKTEAKTPIIHLAVGRISFGSAKLTENIEKALSAVKKDNISKLVLKSTMSPAIKVKV